MRRICGRRDRTERKRGRARGRQRKTQYRARNVEPKADRVDTLAKSPDKARELFTQNEESADVASIAGKYAATSRLRAFDELSCAGRRIAS